MCFGTYYSNTKINAWKKRAFDESNEYESMLEWDNEVKESKKT